MDSDNPLFCCIFAGSGNNRVTFLVFHPWGCYSLAGRFPPTPTASRPAARQQLPLSPIHAGPGAGTAALPRLPHRWRERGVRLRGGRERTWSRHELRLGQRRGAVCSVAVQGKQGPMRNSLAIHPCDAWALSWAPASAISSSLPGTINAPARLFQFCFIC